MDRLEAIVEIEKFIVFTQQAKHSLGSEQAKKLIEALRIALQALNKGGE